MKWVEARIQDSSLSGAGSKWDETGRGRRTDPLAAASATGLFFVPPSPQAGRGPAAAAARRTCLCTHRCGSFTSSWPSSWWLWPCWPLWVSAGCQQQPASPGLSTPGCGGVSHQGSFQCQNPLQRQTQISVAHGPEPASS